MVELVITSKNFGVRPSKLANIQGGYNAYCFDVAASIYLSYLEQGKKPIAFEDNMNNIL